MRVRVCMYMYIYIHNKFDVMDKTDQFYYFSVVILSGFGGLEVSVLAFGTRMCGFKPGRSRRIFRKGSKTVGPVS